jgi:hypothetical protein
MRGKANCCCSDRVQLSPASRRGRTSTTRAWSAASVVSCSVPGTLAQLALAPPPMLPPAAWSGHGCPSTALATVAPRAGRACLWLFPRRRLHRGSSKTSYAARAAFVFLDCLVLTPARRLRAEAGAGPSART